MRRIAAALPVLALALPALAQDPVGLTPAQVGEIFCISIIGSDMAAVSGLLTPELAAAIAGAEAQNRAWETTNPGDKPPLGDGIPWQSGADYSPQCTVGETLYMMDEAQVDLHYAFPDYPDAGYRDRLELRLVPGAFGTTAWRIDNVSFAGDGDLRTALVVAFMDN